jgi:hypothetical protein
MAIVAISTAPSRELYEQVSSKLGSDVPPGMIVHTATEVDGGVRIIDVWESREAMDAFSRRIVPLIADAMGGQPPMPETYETIDFLRG